MAVNALPSEQEPVVDRYRRWNPVWYRWLKPLLQQVRTNTTGIATNTADILASTADIAALDVSVTETAEIVNGIAGRWGIAVNVDNKVVGLIRLDGGASGSTFTVLADKFIVRHPTTTTDITAFVVGLVNGVSTVGINGNLVIDGTVLARHLTVASLSAISANIGTCTAGVVKSSDNKFVIDLNNKTISITP